MKHLLTPFRSCDLLFRRLARPVATALFIAWALMAVALMIFFAYLLWVPEFLMCAAIISACAIMLTILGRHTSSNQPSTNH